MRAVGAGALLASCAVLNALPALAQVAQIPANCSAYLTVQKLNCTVSHFMTCDSFAEGEYRVDDYDAEGVRTATHYDHQMNPLTVIYARLGLVMRQEPSSGDRLSMDELIETGHDTYDMITVLNDSERYNDIGYDMLTDETVIIDGRTLTVTSFELRTFGPDGEVFSHTSGHQYLDRDLRFIFGGVYRDETEDPRPDEDASPVDFIEPGDAGFLSAVPLYTCGQAVAFRPKFHRPEGATP